MSSKSPAKDAIRVQDVESLIEAIKAQASLLDCLVIVGAAYPEVSGILSADEEMFREIVPLGDGTHIVLSVGSLPTKLEDGIHEIEV